MGIVLGIDIGGSTTKICGFRSEGDLITPLSVRNRHSRRVCGNRVYPTTDSAFIKIAFLLCPRPSLRLNGV